MHGLSAEACSRCPPLPQARGHPHAARFPFHQHARAWRPLPGLGRKPRGGSSSSDKQGGRAADARSVADRKSRIETSRHVCMRAHPRARCRRSLCAVRWASCCSARASQAARASPAARCRKAHRLPFGSQATIRKRVEAATEAGGLRTSRQWQRRLPDYAIRQRKQRGRQEMASQVGLHGRQSALKNRHGTGVRPKEASQRVFAKTGVAEGCGQNRQPGRGPGRRARSGSRARSAAAAAATARLRARLSNVFAVHQIMPLARSKMSP
jgi:hypothetical protein